MLTLAQSGAIVDHFAITSTQRPIHRLYPPTLATAGLDSGSLDQQQEAIKYLGIENQVLQENNGKKRISLSDDQRRRLAVKGKVLGRKRTEDVGTLFTPDTILRWHRLLVVQEVGR